MGILFLGRSFPLFLAVIFDSTMLLPIKFLLIPNFVELSFERI